jgi:hypothetical protein
MNWETSTNRPWKTINKGRENKYSFVSQFVLKSISIYFWPMKEIRKPLKRKGCGFNIYGSEGPEYVDLLRALRDPVEIWSIDVDVQA